MPKIHPRAGVLAAATSEAQVFVAELVERHGLSYVELFSALAAVTGAWATLAVREERAQSRAETGGVMLTPQEDA